MQIINTPLKDVLLDHVKNSKKSVKLCSPFIKKQSALDILECMPNDVSLSLITNVILKSFYNNASDISALEAIHKSRGTIYNYQKLHAKIYIFDDKFSIITSANLTPSGLGKNFEYGVLISEKKLVQQTIEDFNSICNSNKSAVINDDHITTIAQLLLSFPKTNTTYFPEIDFYKDELCDAVIDKSLLENNAHFSGWQREVFNALCLIKKQTFSRKDYESSIPLLQKVYPENNHVEAKVRQILQQLRDIGLLRFEGEGVYTKLWN